MVVVVVVVCFNKLKNRWLLSASVATPTGQSPALSLSRRQPANHRHCPLSRRHSANHNQTRPRGRETQQNSASDPKALICVRASRCFRASCAPRERLMKRTREENEGRYEECETPRTKKHRRPQAHSTDEPFVAYIDPPPVKNAADYDEFLEKVFLASPSPSAVRETATAAVVRSRKRNAGGGGGGGGGGAHGGLRKRRKTVTATQKSSHTAKRKRTFAVLFLKRQKLLGWLDWLTDGLSSLPETPVVPEEGGGGD